MKISVTAKNIAEGVPGAFDCPIALAMRRRKMVNVQVANDGVWFMDRACNMVKRGLPFEAVDFIKRFDRGDDVKPIKFDIKADEAAVKED